MNVIKWIVRWILRMFANAFAVVGTLVALGLLMVVFLGVYGAVSVKTLPPNMVLTLDMRGDAMLDQPSQAGFGIGREPISFIELVQALARAEDDERVKGIFLRVGGGMAPAHLQEMRRAIDSFRAKGKFVIAHAQEFFSTGLSEYYVATIADDIWLQPMSNLNTSGIQTTTVFLRGLFDKIEATPHFSQRYEFKNAANVYTETDYTPPHRAATEGLIRSLYDTLVGDMAAARQKDRVAFTGILDAGPYFTETAVSNGLVDRAGYDDDAEKAALDRAGDGATSVSVEDYYEQEGSPWSVPFGSDGVIALVHGEGVIVEGGNGADAFGDGFIGGDTIAQAIRDAAEDPAVRAIVFRVSSPGGSAIASDQILDALRKAQGAGKPVVVSMGPVAASGGYWVSMFADKIYAMPATITGSIGVLSGKLIVNATYGLIGLNPRTLTVGGPNTTMFSEFEDFTPTQWQAFNAQIDQIYTTFTALVSEGRKIPLDRVLEIARGRVWSGVDARSRGLIDEFGGLRDALVKARELGGLAPDATVDVRLYPAQLSPWEKFERAFSASATTMESLALIADAMQLPSVKQGLRALMEVEDGGGVDARMPDASYE